MDPAQRWKLYIELQTSTLADESQLVSLVALLGADPDLADVAPTAANLGKQYSIAATLRVAAPTVTQAKDRAIERLHLHIEQVGLSIGRTLVAEVLPGD